MKYLRELKNKSSYPDPLQKLQERSKRSEWSSKGSCCTFCSGSGYTFSKTHFSKERAPDCEGVEQHAEIAAPAHRVYREGPPYPDGLGRVKCVYCRQCEITEAKAVCRIAKEPMSGIALLWECERFIMQTLQ
jgi:hypothetical protein